MMITIPIQIQEADLKKIDHLVQAGRYKNRNQAIRSMLLDKLMQETLTIQEDTPEKAKRRQEILSLWEQQNIPLEFTITTDKSAMEMISEDRDR